MRGKLVAGNWKMVGNRRSVTELLQGLTGNSSVTGEGRTVVVCPSAIHIPLAAQLLEGSAIRLGAQNAYYQAEGAYTGETSVDMLADYGVGYVIVGHSERRQLFGETDDLVAEKFVAIQQHQLTPILCVGETREQREQQITEQVVLAQLDAVLARAGVSALTHAVVAYEPVWAIGTGLTATPAQAQEVHGMMRRHIAAVDLAVAARVPLIYGGSVNPGNAAMLFAEADIDGGLVGGASLKADDFALICQSLG